MPWFDCVEDVHCCGSTSAVQVHMRFQEYNFRRLRTPQCTRVQIHACQYTLVHINILQFISRSISARRYNSVHISAHDYASVLQLSPKGNASIRLIRGMERFDSIIVLRARGSIRFETIGARLRMVGDSEIHRRGHMSWFHTCRQFGLSDPSHALQGR